MDNPPGIGGHGGMGDFTAVNAGLSPSSNPPALSKQRLFVVVYKVGGPCWCWFMCARVWRSHANSLIYMLDLHLDWHCFLVLTQVAHHIFYIEQRSWNRIPGVLLIIILYWWEGGCKSHWAKPREPTEWILSCLDVEDFWGHATKWVWEFSC